MRCVKKHKKLDVYLEKTWKLIPPFIGYFCQIYDNEYKGVVGFGWSKNKFTAYREALRERNLLKLKYVSENFYI
jgi:hypothetical protein